MSPPISPYLLTTPPAESEYYLFLPCCKPTSYTQAWKPGIKRKLGLQSYQDALDTSLWYQVPKIFLLLSTLYILTGVAGKIWMHFSQFSETTVLCCKSISIIPALCLMLQIQYHAQNYAGIIDSPYSNMSVDCMKLKLGVKIAQT